MVSKSRKSAKKVKSLKPKSVADKRASAVKGGDISIPYGKIEWTYTQQKRSDGGSK